MTAIDLNVDIGEGGAHDDALLPYATSINIACGWHAGDPMTMHRTAAAALARDIAIGAHPSYPDREHFGRRSLEMDREELYAGIQYQIGALAGIVKALGGRLAHVKPHGALYNDAERDPSVADAVVAAVQAFDPSLAVFGLSGGRLVAAARHAGLTAIDETFADRGYRRDGTLVPRSEPGGVIDDPAQVARRTAEMVTAGRVQAHDGSWVSIAAQTMCLHGDGPHAVVFAHEIHAALRAVSCTLSRPLRVDTNSAIP
ncbi:LamB/YcsF family protein [Burkholderia ambifaria]|uniref:5-oxoprolinase subunit PxpA n=1 Tax=Burkholderia ambifaria TaxID=152480 RepID=UPI000CFEFE8F|nr:5-oxoprolinase subunit PxpA [Burkholderia ambifaria]MBR8186521.1 5-oxoprolinase subunit PxpA [Burkholderia ambifaria]PRF98109.1 LamB/YcsF family protein [Burkholderia ambifaria]